MPHYSLLPLTLILSLVVTFIASDPTFVSREEWNARRPKSRLSLKVNPPSFVLVHHSAGNTCTTTNKCKSTVKQIQNYHMDSRRWKDIGYNFLVGGDGLVYEGRGWGTYGAHSPKYNSKSIGICVMGNFEDTSPASVQLDALEDLIEYGVSNSYISENYKLLGHRQSEPTTCPGNKLFEEIKTWSHFEKNP